MNHILRHLLLTSSFPLFLFLQYCPLVEKQLPSLQTFQLFNPPTFQRLSPQTFQLPLQTMIHLHVFLLRLARVHLMMGTLMYL